MPIDSSIALGIRPANFQQRDPIEQYSKGLALKGLLGQQDIQALQLQAARQGVDDESAVRSAYQQAGGDNARLRALLQSGGQFKALQTLDKFELDKRKDEADIGSKTASADKSRYEVEKDKIERNSALLAAAQENPALWPAVRKQIILQAQNPQQAATAIPEAYDPSFVAMNIAKGQTIAQRLADQRARETTAATRRGQDMTSASAAAGRATTQRGQDMTDTRQREANAVAATTAGLRQRELASTLQTKDAAQEQAMASYDTAVATLDRLEKHPGFQAAVGAGVGKTMAPFIGPIPGTDRAGFMKELETFKAQTFLPMVQQLKGMGALSDAEGQKLSAAVGALNEDMPESEFKASIKLIKGDLAAAKERAARARSTSTGAAPSKDKLGGVLTRNADGSFNYGF